ncbi:MAG: Holliday junction resolvase [Candidatus Methanomethylophilaceae archaeon]|jgi:Holliday junction resolvase|nr:Holliday junction resolvase [Candidatus Methanomethylophilaceae archaeon]NLF34169.1 Holliday junction resolvase [Thermoplasmatales archaeon]
MAAPGDVYERELKSLLSGDEKAVAKMTKTCDGPESQAYCSMTGNPFVVIRAAGSLGVDLVALRWDFSFPIEVKSSSEDVMHFSRNPRLGEQADRMREECGRSHMIALYAFRLKNRRGDPWRVFRLPLSEDLRGRMGLLQRRIPEMEQSSNGNYIMRWNDGMKLSDLIMYMDMAGRE